MLYSHENATAQAGRRGSSQPDKRPPSSLSTGSSDSGVFSASALPRSPQPTAPPSPAVHQMNFIHNQTNLMAVQEQLRKEIGGQTAQQRNSGMAQPMSMPLTQMHTPHNSPLELFPFETLQQNHQTRTRSSDRRAAPKPESYKTVICQAWLESKTCSFAENCRFAHGEEELRPSKIAPRQNNKYKTKLCDKYTTTGLCPYGKRCLFIHPDNGPNAYIRSDKLMEVSQRHAMADLRAQMHSTLQNIQPQRPSTPVEMLTQVPLGVTPMRGSSRAFQRSGPHPSWPLEPAAFFSDRTANSRPVSPFDYLAAATLAGVAENMLGTPSAVSGYVSGGSTPMDLESPYLSSGSVSAISAPTTRIPMRPSTCSEEDSFSLAPGFEHLAEDLAKHLDLW